MESRSRRLLLSVLLSHASLAAAASCGSEVEAELTSGSTVGSVPDAAIEDYRGRLLDLAFEVASALPMEPHVKTRSRAQEDVVAACLDLDQPSRALRFIDEIDNWRGGACYADLAFYCAQHGGGAEVEDYLGRAEQASEELARRIEDTTDDESFESAQEWQRDRIRTGIAATYVWLGLPGRAAPFEAGVVDSETGKVDAVKALFMEGDDFDRQLDSLDQVVATASFDRLRNALDACAQLFDRFYDDVDRRSRAEAKIEQSWTGAPVMVRIELSMKLAGFALDHGDHGKALELANDARAMLEGAKWSTRDRISLLAPLAGLRHRAGDAAGARRDADAALAAYEAERDMIVDIYRAGTLRHLAEAYQTMGDSAAALSLYKRAVEEGVGNPNSRPRAEDLSATCCSMALSAVEPDEALWARMTEVQNALGDPW